MRRTWAILVTISLLIAACGSAMKLPAPHYATRQLLISGTETPPETEQAGAFGIVAFTNQPTNATRSRFIKVCEAYVSTLSSQAEADLRRIPVVQRMITFWPVTAPDASLDWMGDCARMVENYSVLEARDAINLAKQTPKARELGLRPSVWRERGPFLLAWSPPVAPASHRFYIFMNLSEFDTEEDLLIAFRTYRDRIENNPAIWADDGRFNLDMARVSMRDFLNRYGEHVVAFFRGG